MKTATCGPDEGRVDLRKSILNFHSLFASAHPVKPFLAEIYTRELVLSVHAHSDQVFVSFGTCTGCKRKMIFSYTPGSFRKRLIAIFVLFVNSLNL